MRILVVVAVLLAVAACSREVVGAPVAGEVPTTTSSAPEEPEVAECTGCERDTVEAAIENPVVGQAKQVGTTPDCEKILPLGTISTIVSATASAATGSANDACEAEYATPDLSRSGLVLMGFDSPVSIEPVAIEEFEGNTLIESAISDQTCEYGIAIDGDIHQFDHGSWLTLRVMSAEGKPPACGLARQLIEIAFENLPAAS